MSIGNNTLKQVRALRKHVDNNLQHLIGEACRILGNPLILYDIDLRVLAYAENESNGARFWDWVIHDGTVKQEIRDTYVSEGLADTIVSSKKTVFIGDDKSGHSWIFGKIYDTDQMPIACVHVLSSYHSPVDDELVVIEALCKVLSAAMLKIPFYQSYAQRKMDACITMLIDRKIEDIKEIAYISGYVEMVYKGLKSNLYVAVADISQRDPSRSSLTYYRDLFKQTRPAFKYSIYANQIIMIMSADEKNFYPKRCLNRLNRLIEQDDIKVGISARFENFLELSRYYGEAVKALSDGLLRNCKQRIFVYEDNAEISIC